MRFRRRFSEPPREEELAALADGSLPAARRAELDARVRESPELAAALTEQLRALALTRAAAADTEAPAALRARVDVERRRLRPSRSSRRRLVWAGGLATAAAVALVLLLILPGNVPGGPSVAEAVVLATRPATQPAPATQLDAPTLLAREVDAVPFPSWERDFGWKTAGARDDSLRERQVTTVFYTKQGKRVGYSIVAGKPLSVPGVAEPARRNGVELHVFRRDGRLVVTWLRKGRTCILSADAVPTATLVKLAAWKADGTLPF